MTSRHDHHDHSPETTRVDRFAEILAVAAILALLSSAVGYQLVHRQEILSGTRPEGLYFWAEATSGFGLVVAAGLTASFILRGEWERITYRIGNRIPQMRAVRLTAVAGAGALMALAGSVANVMAGRSSGFLGEAGVLIADIAQALAWTGGAVAIGAIVTGVIAVTRGPAQPKSNQSVPPPTESSTL